MRAQRYAGGSQPAEVDDAADAAVIGRRREVVSGPPVGLLEIPAAVQGMHEVVGHVHVAQRVDERGPVEHVSFRDLDLRAPGEVAEPLRGPGETAHLITFTQQRGDKPTPDVSRRTCHQHPHALQSTRETRPAHGNARPRATLAATTFSTAYARAVPLEVRRAS